MRSLRKFLRLKSRLAADRKGFAIVLVAALAGLVFLLGASLVVTSQLQSAASQYDQRMRQAREHAMAALEMAVGDLQQRAGRDRAVTILADALRSDRLQDFDDPTGASTSGVHQPFWVGAYDPDATGGVDWLVTRPLRENVAAPDPQDTVTSPVTLVGSGTALPFDPDDQDLFDVRAPREPLVVSNVPGFSRSVTTGHVAYWVGDLGMKASYVLRDKTDQVTHGIYSAAQNTITGARQRLRQMLPSHPDMRLDYTSTFGVRFIFDPNNTDSPYNENEMNNIELIDAFVNDFQFRDDSNPNKDHRPDESWAYLNELMLDSQVKPYFHDFTPLSRGLLIDTRRGGFKKDLSSMDILSVPGDADAWLFGAYNNYFRPFVVMAHELNESDQTLIDVVPNAIQRIYRFQAAPESGGYPPVAPVVTQFNLNYKFFVDSEENLVIEYGLDLELWNPYTSALRLPSLSIEINGLPTVEFAIQGLAAIVHEIDLNHADNKPKFTINVAAEDLAELEPGEVKELRGLDGDFSTGVKYVDLTSEELSDDAIWMRFKEESVRPAIEIAASAGMPVRIVRAAIDYTLSNPDESGVYRFSKLRESETSDSEARFGFTWEVGAPGEDEDNPFNPIAAGYNATMDTIPSSALVRSDQQDSADTYNYSTTFLDASTVVLGEKPENGTSREYNVPLIELPRQETVSLSHLASVYYPSPGGGWLPLGEPGAAANALFDSTFFSTIPPTIDFEETGGTIPVLPNASIQVLGAGMDILQSRDSAQALYLNGAFNLNSTSMHAWAAMLKGVAADGSGYFDLIDDVLGNIPAVGNLLSGLFPAAEPRYAFLNHPQSSQEWLYLPGNGLAIGQVNATLLDGAVFLDEEEVDELARQIVSEIRKWTDANDRPFTTIQEFLDAGILANAIAAAGINSESTLPFSPRYLSQTTLMNLLAPFLSARSDTFLVRAYGDVANPADPEEVWARAYCEAVVQRVHAKHRTEADQNVLTPTSRATQSGQFGREFRVIAFRWLTPDEV